MDETQRLNSPQPTGRQTPAQNALGVILLAGVVQGWALYWLHDSLTGHRWPGTDPGWLLGLGAVVIFGPASMQMLASRAHRRATWVSIAIICALWFYFGWHHGRHVAGLSIPSVREYPDVTWFEFFFPLTVLWLIVLPFLQGRLDAGRWRAGYPELFRLAWRNKLMLAEAGVFTALLWLLLLLWAGLFDMLNIAFFADIFREPMFICTVTSLTFALALHLAGNIDRLTSVALEQILSVLKWLAPVAATILLLFSIALLFRSPELVFTGRHAIRASWLLWLTAGVVLLMNAAYRDGSVEFPYPRPLAAILRFVVPTTIIVALTAAYSLWVRADHYGLTVERVWAFVVAGAGLAYAVGYAMAAARSGRWMAMISRVNVTVAIALIAVISLALTPVMSPYRLAAISQERQVLRQTADEIRRENPDHTAYFYQHHESPMWYLEHDAGQYGRDRMAVLAHLQDHPRAADIRAAAAATMELHSQQDRAKPLDLDAEIRAMPIFPAGRMPDAGLIAALKARRTCNSLGREWCRYSRRFTGLFVDLDGDGSDEFVLISEDGNFASEVFEQNANAWKSVGGIVADKSCADCDATPRIKASMDKGEIKVTPPRWKELTIGDRLYRVNPSR